LGKRFRVMLRTRTRVCARATVLLWLGLELQLGLWVA
jgi:hypothetical protein